MKNFLLVTLLGTICILAGCTKDSNIQNNPYSHSAEKIQLHSEENVSITLNENWEKYVNKKFGYTVEIPKGSVSINEYNDQKYVEILGPESSKKRGNAVKIDGFSYEKWAFSIYENKDNLTLEQFINEYEKDPTCILSRKKIRIADQESIEILDQCEMGSPAYHSLILKGKQILVVKLIYGDKKTYDHILSTLKFNQ